MARLALVVGFLGLSTLAACGEKVERCLEPPAGSRSDVTLAFEDQTGFTAAECPDPTSSDGAFLVRGTTSQRLFEDRAPDDFSKASRFSLLVISDAAEEAPSFHQHNVGLLGTDCDRARGLSHYAAIVFLSDWADVDATIERIGHTLKEADLGEEVIVAVNPPFCPD